MPRWPSPSPSTLAFRPVGAFLFGLLADRYGRRLPLMIDLVFYSVVEVLTGFAPNFTTFLVLRALFGIGMGGEWGVGASLAMEKVPPRLRGLLSGLLQQGYAAGYLLAAICYFFLFERWGWRPLFFLGGVPALLALLRALPRQRVRSVAEEPKQESWAQIGRAIASHWKLFLYMTLLMTMMNFSSHGTQDMYPTFLQRQWGFPPRERSLITAISMVGAILGGTLVGLLSDRIGRRRALILSLLSGIVGGSAVGLGSFGRAAHRRSVSHPVLRAGRLGRDSGAPERALAGFHPRLPARLRVSVRRAAGGIGGLLRGGAGQAIQLLHGYGVDGHHCVRGRGGGDGAGA